MLCRVLVMQAAPFLLEDARASRSEPTAVVVSRRGNYASARTSSVRRRAIFRRSQLSGIRSQRRYASSA